MMFVRQISAVAAVLALAASRPVGAQERGITLFASGGGYSALRDLNSAGTDQFERGFTLGGGVGYAVDKNLELRATLTGAQSRLVDQGRKTSAYLNRYYVAGELKFKYPFGGGLAPYGFVGLGAVRLHETRTTGGDKTQGFADLGVGLAYGVGKSGLSLFVQGTGFFYSLTELTSP